MLNHSTLYRITAILAIAALTGCAHVNSVHPAKAQMEVLDGQHEETDLTVEDLTELFKQGRIEERAFAELIKAKGDEYSKAGCDLAPDMLGCSTPPEAAVVPVMNFVTYRDADGSSPRVYKVDGPNSWELTTDSYGYHFFLTIDGTKSIPLAIDKTPSGVLAHWTVTENEGFELKRK